MKIAIISALGNEALKKCIVSLLETSSVSADDIFIIRERGPREDSLNAAIGIIGRNDDILFVGDDIIFTRGWYEAFMDNYRVADIIGLTTLYPRTGVIQDNGYDLVAIDDTVTLEAFNRNKKASRAGLSGYRYCDAPCGCLMLVKKNVFKIVSAFPREGENRWGEFLFAQLAKRKKAKVAVLGHCVFHEGTSTKSNPNKRLSSISYKLERKIWDSIVGKYLDKGMIRFKYTRAIAKPLLGKLNSSGSVLLYGAGTVSEFLLRRLKNKQVGVCSGLAEEWGKDFFGYKIADYRQALKKAYDLVVITPLYVGDTIYKDYIVPFYKHRRNAEIIKVVLGITGNKYEYGMSQLLARRRGRR